MLIVYVKLKSPEGIPLRLIVYVGAEKFTLTSIYILYRGILIIRYPDDMKEISIISQGSVGLIEEG